MVKKLTALALLPVILAVLTVLSLAVVARSGAIERILATAGADIIDGTCQFEALYCEPFGGVVIEGISLQSSVRTDPLIRVREIRLRFATGSLLAGDIAPESVTLLEPEFHFSETGTDVGQIATYFETSGGGNAPASLSIEIRDGTCRKDGIPIELTSIDASLRITEGNVTVEHVEGDLAGGNVRVDGYLAADRKPATFQFNVEGRGVICQPGMEPLMKLIGALKDYRAFQPQGRMDFRFESDPLSGIPVTGSLRLMPHRIDAAYLGYPDRETGLYKESFLYPVSDLSGIIDVRVPGDVRIEEVNGVIGGGRVAISGKVVSRRDFYDRDLLIEARDLKLDQMLFGILEPQTPQLAEYLTELRLGGEADVAITLTKPAPPGEKNGIVPRHVRLSADLAGVSLQPEFAPGIVEIESGTLFADADGFRLKGVKGKCGGMAISVDGRLGPDGTALAIQADDVFVDEEFLANLRKSLPVDFATVEGLGLAGRGLSVRCDYVRRLRDGTPENSAENQADLFSETLDLEFRLDGCSAVPDFFPVALEDLEGTVTVRVVDSQLQHASFKDLTASHAGSALTATGLWESGALQSLEVTGAGQRITPELLSAISDSAPELSEYVSELKAEGSADFRFRHDGRDAILGVEAHLQNVQSPISPLICSDFDGKVSWYSAESALILEDVFVRVERGLLSIENGQIHVANGTAAGGEGDSGERTVVIEMQGSGQGIRLDQNLARTLGGGVHSKWRLFGIDGLVNLDNFDLAVTLSGSHRLESVQGTVGVTLEGVSMESPLSLSDVYGRVTLTARKTMNPDLSLDLAGESDHLSFALEGKELSNVKTRFVVNDRVLRIVSLEGLLYGGYITGDEDTFRVFFDSPASFKGRLLGRGSDLNRLIGRSDFALRDISGQLGWNIRFSGEMENIADMKARGRVKVENGRLWELPVFSDLWGPIDSVMGLGEPPTFEEGDARFTLDKGVLTLTDAGLTSSLMSLDGTGFLTPAGASLQVEFTVGPRVPILSEIISPVWDLFKSGFMSLRVTGPYDNLNVTYDPILTSPFWSREVIESVRYPARRKFDFTDGF